jgi:predicted metalloprotease with PDZ domain
MPALTNMKAYLIRIFFTLPWMFLHLHAKEPLDIKYSFAYANDLQITLEFTGDSSGSSQLFLPHEWAGQKELYKEIYDLQCSNHPIQETEKPEIKIIHHAPHETITLSYKVHLVAENISRKNFYRPLGNNSYFFSFGYGLFILPHNPELEANITLVWNQLPAHWTIANSHGANQVQQKHFLPFIQLQHALFLAGDFNLIQCGPSANPVYIATRGDLRFTNDEFVHLTEEIIKSQRDFWKDYDFPHYLITAIPIEDENVISGTATTNAFSLFLGKFTYPKDEYLNRLAHMISHEHFHTWIGQKMASSEQENSMFWFTEGFTEYYSIKLNYQNGIMTLKQYVDHTNELLAEYFESSVHHESNDRIVKDFWNDPEVQRLPYFRGYVLASYWDSKIKNTSSGLYCLDNVMHDLQKATRDKGTFSKADLITILSRYLPEEEISKIEQHVTQGESIPIDESMFQNEYRLEWTDNLGFDLQQSLAAGVIRWVKPKSLAAQSGLKNGLKLLGWNREGTKVHLTVSEKDDVVKTISYDLIALKKIPKFVLSQ